MASAAAVPEATVPAVGAAAAPSVRMLPLLMVVLLTVLLTVGGVTGALLYLIKAGRLGGGSASTIAAAKPESTPPATHAVALEPMLVNLADADGHSYLRAGVTIEVEDPPKGKKAAKAAEGKEGKEGKGAADANAPLRDAVLTVLGRQQSTELLAADGKDRLRAALKTAITERSPETKVSEVYFTEFLVQR